MGIFPGGFVDAQKHLGATHAAGSHEYAARMDNSLVDSTKIENRKDLSSI